MDLVLWGNMKITVTITKEIEVEPDMSKDGIVSYILEDLYDFIHRAEWTIE